MCVCVCVCVRVCACVCVNSHLQRLTECDYKQISVNVLLFDKIQYTTAKRWNIFCLKEYKTISGNEGDKMR